jgi:hypothetical protein
MLAHGDDTRDMIQRPLEFLGNIMLLIVGGNDTTRNSISGGVLALNQFPEQLDKLKADPSVIPNMVAEIIRWQTPVLHMRRTLKADYEYAGKRMKAGDKVVLWYISGNRDERVFDRRRPADHRPPERASARLVRLRHPPLHGQPPGRDAAARRLGRDRQTLPLHRGGRAGTATEVELHSRHPRAAGARCTGTAEPHQSRSSGTLKRA